MKLVFRMGERKILRQLVTSKRTFQITKGVVVLYELNKKEKKKERQREIATLVLS